MFSKSSVFFAPLLLTEFMSKSDYGKVEYSIGGLGFIINTILGFGIPSSYAYFILKKKDIQTKSGYSLYLLILALYYIIVQCLFFIFPNHIYLSLIISFILANQVYYSYVFKTQEKAIYATLMDSGIYFVILLVILIKQFSGTNVAFKDIFVPMLIYSGMFLLITIYKSTKIKFRDALVQLKKIISYSWYLLIGAFVIILLMNSGRFILEFFLKDFEGIGEFGFYLRISGISLVVFQMMYILYFKKIYTKNIKDLDKLFAVFLSFILIYSITSLYALPIILSDFSNFFKETYPENRKVFFMLTFFTFFWTSYNLFSNIIVRESLAKNYNYYLFVVLAIFSIVLLLIPGINVELFTIIQLYIGVIIAITQQILLFRKGYVFKSTFYVLVAAIVLTIMTTLIF